MISTEFYIIGFLVYVIFCSVTFEFYKKSENNTPAGFSFIYIYYSILAAYVINFVNANEDPLLRIFQILVYCFACGLVLYYYYSNVMFKKGKEWYEKV